MPNTEISPRTPRLKLLRENLKEKGLGWNRENLIAENAELNKGHLWEGLKRLGSIAFDRSLVRGIYTVEGRDRLDEAREFLIPAFVEIFNVYEKIQPRKKQKDEFVREWRRLEEAGKTEEASEVREQIQILRGEIANFWATNRTNIKKDWKEKYKEGTKQVIKPAENVGDMKVIEGSKITVPDVEAKVIQRWVKNMMGYGLSEEHATNFIKRSIALTKKIQEWQGASENSPEGGLRAKFERQSLSKARK